MTTAQHIEMDEASDLAGRTINYIVRVSKKGDRHGESYMTEPDQIAAAQREIVRIGARVGRRLDVPERDQSGFTARGRR